MHKWPLYLVTASVVLALLAGCTGVPTPPKRVPALATAARLVEATRPALAVATAPLRVTQPPQPTLPALMAPATQPPQPTLPALLAAATEPATAQAAGTAAAGTPAGVAAAGAGRNVDEAAVITGTYELPDIGTVNLANGQGDVAKGTGKVANAHTTYQAATFGDLNGDGLDDAAVLLATNTGGSGTFFYLVALLQQQDGSLKQAAATLLGDRVQVRSLPILDGQIVLTMITHGPNDPMCCPTQQVTQTYQLQGNTLKQISGLSEGPAASAPVTATVAAVTPAAAPATAVATPVSAGQAPTAQATPGAATANPTGQAPTATPAVATSAAATASPTGQAPTPATAAAATPGAGKVDEAAVKTRSYTLPDIGTVNLVNGQGNLGKGVSAVSSAQTIYQTSAFGDLNGDGLNDAAVVLATNTGGSGTFIYLVALVQQQDGSLNQAAVTLLGDRVQVKSLTIQDGKIVVDMVTQGPNDPMCCPTQQVTQIYQLEGNTLKQVNTAGQAQATAAPAGLTGALTGTVTYRERVALPPQAIIEVSLEDVSRADAPAKVVEAQNIIVGRKQAPIPFALSYDPAQIDPKNTYRVAARITENGQLRWISTQMYPVLTRNAPQTGVEIVVQQVGAPASGSATPAAGGPTVAPAAPQATPSAPATSAAITSTTSGKKASLAGTVTLQERLAIPKQAVLMVELQDVSEPNAPPLTVAYELVPTNGQQAPLAFNLIYDAAQIDPQGSYVVAARITVGDYLRWINNQPYPVLTQGHPAQDVQIVVHRVIN